MDSQLFYFLNAVFAGAFLFWFLAGRKGSPKPTPLNLKAGKKTPTIQKTPFVHDYPVKYTPRERDVTGTGPGHGPGNRPLGAPDKASKGQKIKLRQSGDEQSKRAQFVYNSHDWNAYEIFGLKPDATLPEVTARYQAMIKKSEPGSLEFLETAYKAILKLI